MHIKAFRRNFKIKLKLIDQNWNLKKSIKNSNQSSQKFHQRMLTINLLSEIQNQNSTKLLSLSILKIIIEDKRCTKVNKKIFFLDQQSWKKIIGPEIKKIFSLRSYSIFGYFDNPRRKKRAEQEMACA